MDRYNTCWCVIGHVCGVSIELIATVQLQLYLINASFSQVSFVYVNVVLSTCSDLLWIVLQVHRCRQSIAFSLQCAWLLGAYSSDMHISTQRHSRGTKLRKLILSDELKPAGPRARRDPLALALAHFCPVTSDPGPPGAEHGLSPSKRTHQRSKSDATVSISLSTNLKRTASNPKVESSPDEVSDPVCSGL